MPSLHKLLTAFEERTGLYLSAAAVQALIGEMPALQALLHVRARKEITEFTEERWVPTPGLASYEISSLGRIRRSIPSKGYNAVVGRILKQHQRKKSKYRWIELVAPAGRKSFLVNRLVALAFHGPPPSALHYAAHGDGDPLNNRENNIRWATPLENAADTKRHGRTMTGSKHWAAKLSDADAVQVRALKSAGVKTRLIAEQFGVTRCTVTRVVRASPLDAPSRSASPRHDHR